MCGFTGFMELGPGKDVSERTAIAMAMADTIVDRGPDDGQAWADPNWGFAMGFRRLAIIDLSEAGRQPMRSADGRYVITFNGEAYNAPELRPELEARGIRFRGHSDTEVVLESCAAFGVEVTVSRLIGMFAFALWDREERTLVLVRDRLGIKPLYFGQVGKVFYFGSQPKTFSAHPDWEARVNHGSLAAYTRFGYVPSPHSIFQGLRQLAPGQMAFVDVQGEARLKTYWNLRQIAANGIRAEQPGDPGEWVDEAQALLRDAVGRRMLADVPLGAFLSGGVDSSLVVALMQSQSERPVKTFSIGFWESSYDEAPHARAIAEHLGTEHHELYVEPSHALDVIPQLSEWYDEPFSDSSQIPTLLVSRMTREHVTVCLSGDGGDELYGGYSRYAQALGLWNKSQRLPSFARNLLRHTLTAVPSGAWDFMGKMAGGRFASRRLGPRVARLAEMLAPGTQEAMYRDLVSQWHDATQIMNRAQEPIASLWEGSLTDGVGDFHRRMQLIDMLTYLPDDILTKVDRASMGVSLEARVPLLDHRVVEKSWTHPFNFSVRGGTTKWLLREILYRHVPRELIERPKMGFGVPIDEWLRGPLRDWAEDLLDEKRLREDGYFNPEPVRRRWDEHVKGLASWHYPLWVVLMFQDWKRRWGAT